MIFYSNKKYTVLSLFFLIFIEISVFSSTINKGFEIFGGIKEGGLFSKNVNYQKTIDDSSDIDNKLTKISNTLPIITQVMIDYDREIISDESLIDQTLLSKFTKKYENFNNKNNILLKITPIINYNIFSEKKYNINNIDYSLFKLFNSSKNKDTNKKEDQNFLKNFNEILNKINNNIKDILNEIRNININQLELYLSEIKEYDQKIAKEELFKKETDKWTKYIDKHINESDIYKNFQNELKILEDKNEFKMQEYFYFLMQNDFFKNKDLEEILINNQNPTIFYEKNKDFINNTYNEGKIIKGFLFQYILSIIIVNTTRKELPQLLKHSDIKGRIEKKLIDILKINNEENEENNFIKELISKKVNNYLTFFYEQQKPKQIKNQNQNENKEQKENKPKPETKPENIAQQEQNIKEQKNTNNININENNIQESQNNSQEKKNTPEFKKTKSNITIKNLEIPDEEESTKEKPSEENTKKENSARSINSNLIEEKNEKIDINTNLNNINNKISELDNFLNKQIDELVDLETKIEDINENKSIEEIENLLKNSENDDKQINTIKEKIESIIKSDQNNNIENKNKMESLILNINEYLTINKNENEIDMELINEYKKNLNEIIKLINI
jgi:hypothetical protein